MNDDATRIRLPPGFVPQGTRLSGIYEIDAPLAKGGMGEIYRGHAIETGDPVAIKLIRADMADNEAALALFRREASALNRLHHEAIVRYYVFSLDPGLQRHYLAMELVEGVALSNLVASGPLSAADAHGLMQRVASGLQAAHERGIVHRDISPDNIIVEDGNVSHARIIDFGIARSTRVGDSTVIGSGFAGKYNYVSPEQLGLYGGDVTGRSDIYSLGLVLAQCLRGKPLDMGGSQADIIDKRRKVPDLADIDPRMRPLLERMLQPDPLDRPASMAEVAAAPLSEITGRGKRAAPAAKPKPAAKPALPGGAEKTGSMKWIAASVAGAALLGAAGFVGYLQFSEPWKFDPPKQDAATLQPVRPPEGPRLDPPPDTPSIPAAVPVAVPVNPPVTPPVAPPITPVAIPIAPPVAPPVAPPAGIDPAERVLRYIRDYDGGDCFLALPLSVSGQSAEIEALALDDKPFEVFDAAFKKANGWEAMIDGGQIRPGQCAAVRFVRALRAKAGAVPAKLEIVRTLLKGNEPLEGTLTTAAANATLLLIDDDGGVLDVTSRLLNAGGRRSFAIGISRSGGTRPQPTLLLAVAGARPLAALRPASGAGKSDLFPAALREAEAQGGPLEVAVKYFKVQ